VDAAGQLSELAQGLPCFRRRLLQRPREHVISVTSHLFSRQTQRQHQAHQPLLSAIVKVALDPLPFCVPGGNDPCPGGSDLHELCLDLGSQAAVGLGQAARP
jgi:hypothetical protein